MSSYYNKIAEALGVGDEQVFLLNEYPEKLFRFSEKNGLEASSDNKKWELADYEIANNIFVGRYKMYLPWKPTDKYYYIDGSISEPTIKLGLFSENEVQGMEHYFSGNCFKDLETANKYLSGYAFLLKDRFVKSIGISGGKII